MIIVTKTRVNGEGNIRQRADGRWEVRITIGTDFTTGNPKRISRYAATQEEAVKILHELSYIKDTTPRNFDNMTLGKWLDLCLEVYMKNSLKQSTYNSYEGYIRNHIKPILGRLRLKEITPRLLQQYYNHKFEAEGLAPKTIVNINLFLHKALSYAVTEGYLLNNPAETLNLPRGQKPQINILSRDEQERLIQVSYQFRYGVFIRLVLFTGLRLGELLGLRWEDIDFRSGLLYVRRTLNRLKKQKENIAENECKTEIVIQPPKSQNSIRSIPLLQGIINDLLLWKSVQEADCAIAGKNYCDSGFVVTNVNGGFIEPRTFHDYYVQMLNAAQLRHFTFHELRHTFASRAMEQGMDAKTLSEILGHYSVAFTLDTYAHVLNDHKHEEILLMEELFSTKQTQNRQLFSYPVVVTMQENGEFCFTLPDFPKFYFIGNDFAEGIENIKEQLSETVLSMIHPPQPTPVENIPIGTNQTLFQIPI